MIKQHKKIVNLEITKDKNNCVRKQNDNKFNDINQDNDIWRYKIKFENLYYSRKPKIKLIISVK